MQGLYCDTVAELFAVLSALALYAFMNAAVYIAGKQRGHPWLAVAKFNTLLACQFANLFVAVACVLPRLSSAGEGGGAVSLWIAAHAAQCTLAFVGVVAVFVCVGVHCAFAWYARRLDRCKRPAFSKV